MVVRLLFAYDELQSPAVQCAVLGRELLGTADCVVGYELRDVVLTDQVVVERSGDRLHRSVVLGHAGSRIDGTAYDVTEADVLHADAFRPDDFSRVEVPLESGVTAWIYAFNPTPASTWSEAEETAATEWRRAEHRRRLHDEVVRCALRVQHTGRRTGLRGYSRHFIAAVALVVRDSVLLDGLGLNENSVLTAWSVMLWGTRRGRQDQLDEMVLTHAWIERCSELVAHPSGR